MNMESTTALYELMKDPDQNREHSLYFLADNEYNKQHSLQYIYELLKYHSSEWKRCNTGGVSN